MTEIDPDVLGDRLQQRNGETFVLDIRHQDDFTDWHIPGSVNVDVYNELTSDPDGAKGAFTELPDDKEIVTVCAVGRRLADSDGRASGDGLRRENAR